MPGASDFAHGVVEIRNLDPYLSTRLTVQEEGQGKKPRDHTLFPHESMRFGMHAATNFRVRRETKATPETDRKLVRAWLDRQRENEYEMPDKAVKAAIRRLTEGERDG